MTNVDGPPLPAPDRTEKRSFVRRLVPWVLTAILVVIALFALAVLNNNYSLSKPSRAEFNAQLDRAIDTSTAWIVQPPEIQGNPPLISMIGDMAEISGDPRLRSYVASDLNSKWTRQPGKPATWYHA